MTKDEAFSRLGKSKFRSRFKLTAEDLAYIDRVGLATIRRHAEDFVRQKLAPAEPEKDGRQTPMRGHPVFKAMHGSAMCCRGCMEKWWKVRKGCPLSVDQQRKVVDFLMAWIEEEQRRLDPLEMFVKFWEPYADQMAEKGMDVLGCVPAWLPKIKGMTVERLTQRELRLHSVPRYLVTEVKQSIKSGVVDELGWPEEPSHVVIIGFIEND